MRRLSEMGLLVALVGLLVFVAVRLIRPAEERGKEVTHRTTRSAKATGWKAFALLVEQYERKVTRMEEPPTQWSQKQTVIIVGTEYSPSLFVAENAWTEREAETALEWVEAGGTLVLLMEDNNELTRSAGITPDSNGAKEIGVFAPIQPTAFQRHTPHLSMPQCSFASLPEYGVPLIAGRDGKVRGLYASWGDGHIVWIGSAGMADNSHIAEGDNARFLVALVQYFSKKGETIAFDEYHQGGREAVTFWTLLGKPGQRTVWQLVGVLLLAAVSAAVRFGLPRPLPRTSRVSAEYVGSLADLYRNARAGRVVLTALVDDLWRDLCRETGQPSDASVTLVIQRAVRLIPCPEPVAKEREERLARTITSCRNAEDNLKDRELLTLAQQIESLRKELGIERRI